MKLNKFFIAAIAATTLFASCSKENVTDGTTGDQTIVVRLPDNVVTRSVDDQVATGTSTTLIGTEVMVYLLNGNSVVGTPVVFDAADVTAKYKRLEQVPASVNRAIVVANYGSTNATALQALTNATAIKNFAFTIASQNPAVATGITGKTLIGDQSTFVTTPTDPASDGHTYKEFNITLNAITARVEIGAVKNGTGVESVELISVWVNNYYTDGSKASTQLNASNAAVWPILTATTGTSAFSDPASVTYSAPEYYNAYSSQVDLSAASKVYAYHVFAGNLPHVIMLVKGVYASGYYDEDAGTKYFIGYVTFNKFMESTSEITAFEANQIYKIGVGTDGVKIDAKDITKEPETSKFDLGINVTVTQWTARTITPGVQ